MKSETVEPEAAAPRGRGRRKLNRAEKAEATRARLFEAAVQTVGELGYAGASVARITERAKVAQGTFYNYFDSRQDLLDQLLPAISNELLAYVRRRVLAAPDCAVERERARMSAFFDFLQEKPQLYKMINQGRVQSPKGFAIHLNQATVTYMKAVEQERRLGNLRLSDPEQIEVVAHMLLGSREYLSERYCFVEGEIVSPPPHVLDAYVDVAAAVLFKRAGEA
ncbi:MAG: TetR/AcrR family transcriptional regulator [Rhizobiaceae bacterium]|nr:TetR/AcrR family transcriptional regulator [Rhizobiaceae bacterium]MCV0409019.1 TetR/AcrR family transcriptional regulator [Rhizobiaceae bacterium]